VVVIGECENCIIGFKNEKANNDLMNARVSNLPHPGALSIILLRLRFPWGIDVRYNYEG